MSTKYWFECKYCGHKWEKMIYYSLDVNELKCDKCKDKHIKVKKEDDKIDYYAKE